MQLPQVSQVNSGLNFIIGCLNRLRTVGPAGRDLKVFRCSSFPLHIFGGQYGESASRGDRIVDGTVNVRLTPWALRYSSEFS